MLDKQVIDLHEGLVDVQDPLTLDLDDSEYSPIIDDWIKTSVSHYENKNLYQRQDKNVQYYMGRQLDLRQFTPKSGNTPYVENVVYEATRRIKATVMSRMPDLVVKSGPDGNNTDSTSESLTDIFNTDIKRRENRKLYGTAHVQERLYFYAWVKGRWNPAKGTDGDYEFINVHPKNIVWDEHCKTNNADDMQFVAENQELRLKDICMMFPKKANEFLEYLGEREETGTDLTEKHMASRYKIWEVWFDWFKKVTDDVGQTKYEKVSGVVWKCEDFILGKMKNPYYDFEGQLNIFTPELKEKFSLDPQAMQDQMFGEQDQANRIYYNYFKSPRKPYFMMVYESLGEDPIDATNAIEQILLFQDHINQEGAQIISMNEMSAGKPVFNSDALDKKTVERLNWKNPKQAISVNGDDINKVFTHVEMPAAPAQLYKSKTENRNIAFEMLGVGATSRGVQDNPNQTLGEAQLFKEADSGFLDDLVEETINELAEWQAEWSMQFIRLFYTKPHFKESAGKDGESLYISITQDAVEDGQVVEVSASGTDKMQRKRLAMENAKIKLSDPLSYYEDTDQSNPKERTYRAMLFTMAPQMYMQQYVMPQGAIPQQPGMQGAALPPDNPPMPGGPPGAPTPTPSPGQSQQQPMAAPAMSPTPQM